jgi:hypothetical protein
MVREAFASIRLERLSCWIDFPYDLSPAAGAETRRRHKPLSSHKAGDDLPALPLGAHFETRIQGALRAGERKPEEVDKV